MTDLVFKRNSHDLLYIKWPLSLKPFTSKLNLTNLMDVKIKIYIFSDANFLPKNIEACSSKTIGSPLV